MASASASGQPATLRPYYNHGVLAAFLDGLPPGASCAPDTADVLAAKLAGARAAHPAIAISDEDFARELGRRLGDPAGLAGCHADDVLLMIACGRGDTAAIAELDAALVREVASAGHRTNARPDQ